MLASRCPNWLALLVAMLALVATNLSLASPAMAAVRSVDLTASLSGPVQGQAGGEFTYIATFGNLGPDDGSGATIQISLASGSSSVAATCTSAGGSAACPSGLTIDGSGSIVTATLGQFPSGGTVEITVTGRFPVDATSATATALITAPSDAQETADGSNSSSQSTILDTATAELAVSKVQDHAAVASGEARVYTVTFENLGPSDLHGIQVTDSYTVGSSSETAYRLECDASSSAPCPEWIGAAGYSGSTSSSSMQLFGQAYRPIDLAVGETLVLKASLTTTLTGCSSTETVNATNRLFVSGPDVNGVELPESYDRTVPGTITGAQLCETAELAVSKVQDRAEVASGEARVYALTFENLGPSDLHGIQITDSYVAGGVPSTTNYQVQCDASSTAACPDWVGAGGLSGTSNYSSAQLFGEGYRPIDLAVGEVLVLKVSVTTTLTGCNSTGFVTASNRVFVSGPDANGVEIPDSYERSVSGTITGVPLCATTALAVSKVQDRDVVASGEERIYTLAFENLGPTDLHGIQVTDFYTVGVSSTTDYRVQCSAASTAPCPDWVGEDGLSNTSGNSNTQLLGGAYLPIDLAVGETLVLDVSVTTTLTTCPSTGTVNAGNEVFVSGPDANGVLVPDSYKQTVSGTITCNDVATQTAVSASIPTPGQPFSVISTISNAVGAARDVDVLITLPTNGFIAPNGAVVIDCTATVGAACPSLSYDPATHTVSGTVAELPGGSSVVVTIHGEAGLTPPTTDSFHVTTSATSLGDIAPMSNTSFTVFGYTNTRSAITATLQITGAPAEVIATLAMTGDVTCESNGSVPVSLASDGSSQPVATVWNHDSCTVEFTRPDAPDGYHWVSSTGDDLVTTHADITADIALSFTLVLEADPVPSDTEVPLPGVPDVTDVCGPDNAEWVVPDNTDELSWSVSDAGELVVTVPTGFAFPDGATSHSFGFAPDSNQACDDVPAPGGDAASTPDGGSTAPVASTSPASLRSHRELPRTGSDVDPRAVFGAGVCLLLGLALVIGTRVGRRGDEAK